MALLNIVGGLQTSIGTVVDQVTTPAAPLIDHVLPPIAGPAPQTDATTLNGTAGDNELTGDVGRNVIDGGTGNDWIFGREGADTIFGGDGNDHLFGHSAAGGDDDGDRIDGGAGHDYVQANAGNDTVYGGSGNDRVQAGRDDDWVDGGEHNDALNGNRGDDTIFGGEGDDTVRGGRDDDRIDGGSGADHLYGDLGYDTISGGEGADVFHFAAGTAPTLSLANLLGTGEVVTDFQDGLDRIALDFVVDDVVHGAVQSTLAGAIAVAQQLLAGAATAVAAVQVGGDTLLFYNSGGQVAGNMVQLQDVDADDLTIADFAG